MMSRSTTGIRAVHRSARQVEIGLLVLRYGYQHSILAEMIKMCCSSCDRGPCP